MQGCYQVSLRHARNYTFGKDVCCKLRRARQCWKIRAIELITVLLDLILVLVPKNTGV